MTKRLVWLLFGAMLAVQLLALDFKAKTFTDQVGLKPVSSEAIITVTEGQQFQATVVNLDQLATRGVRVEGLKKGTSVTVTYKGGSKWSFIWASKDVPFDWKKEVSLKTP